MSTRNGKIARLPHDLRQQLNRRLENGEPGQRLVGWLNGLPEVQAVLQAEFDGRPISEQNLSEWKQGGYREWVKQQERRALARQLAEHATELDDDAGGVDLSDRLAVILSTELAQAAGKLLEQTTDSREHWEQLQEVLHEVARLRREDHKAGQLRLERERWEAEQTKAHAEKAAAGAIAPLHVWLAHDLMTDLLHRSEPTAQAMAMQTAHTVPLQSARHEVDAGGGNPVKSNPIQPDQTV